MNSVIRLVVLVSMSLAAGCATSGPRKPPVVIPSEQPAVDVLPVEPVKTEPVVEVTPPVVDDVEPVVEAEPAVPFRTMVAVQAALDRSNFSCNAIDGELSERMRDVLRTWQDIRGLPVTGEVDEPTLNRVGDIESQFMKYEVTAEDHAALTDHPSSWRQRAVRKRLGFATILELVAEKHNCAEETIRRMNPGLDWPNPPAGSLVDVPRVKPAKWVEAARLEISLSKRQLKGYDADNRLVLFFPCSIAKDVAKRPVGDLKIVNAASDPIYTFDPAVFPEDPEAQQMTVKLVIPPGPNNPVGVAWLSLDRPGYGIHGTAWPEDIGKTESHGCFRLANWNAAKLVKMVKLGTPVKVME